MSPDPMRGREPVAPARGVRAGARGRGQQATHSGGAGAPPGGTTTPCEELADGGPFTACPRLRMRAATQKGPGLRAGGRLRRSTEKRGPAPQGKRRTARREAPRVRKTDACKKRTVAPLGAPSPSLFREGPNAPRRRGENNSGAITRRENDGACPNVNSLCRPRQRRPRKARPDDRLQRGHCTPQPIERTRRMGPGSRSLSLAWPGRQRMGKTRRPRPHAVSKRTKCDILFLE